jgi:aminoglycoside phosphotransferase (APT) family kinase protein
VLVHGDLHIRNVMCSPDTGQVRAALDWELSTLGDPLADFGTLLAYWPEAGEAPRGVLRRLGAAGLRPPRGAGRDVPGRLRARRRRAGLLARARHVEDRHHRRGVRRRALEEPRNAAEGGPPTHAVIDHLVDRAWDLVGHYGL